MYSRIPRQDLNGCVTNEDLAQLFDHAFGTWQAGVDRSDGRRETPRIASGQTKPIFVASYAHAGREVDLNQRATIADVSADGLGIVQAEPLPVGAVVCFAFDDQDGDRHYGVAMVVRVAKHEGAYRIGLTFTENARSLDIDGSSDEVDGSPVAAERWTLTLDRLKEAVTTFTRVFKKSEMRDGGSEGQGARGRRGLIDRWREAAGAAGLTFERGELSSGGKSGSTPPDALPGWAQGFSRLRAAAAVAHRVLTQRQAAHRQLDISVYDRKARFVVEAKLFRYVAALHVEGREVVRRVGRLRDRLYSLFYETATPTLLHLESGGFSAWAALRPHAVADCGLDLSLPLKQQIYSRVVQLNSAAR
jgi:hypothetical protein